MTLTNNEKYIAQFINDLIVRQYKNDYSRIDDLFYYACCYLLNAKDAKLYLKSFYVRLLEKYIKLIENELRDPVLP